MHWVARSAPLEEAEQRCSDICELGRVLSHVATHVQAGVPRTVQPFQSQALDKQVRVKVHLEFVTLDNERSCSMSYCAEHRRVDKADLAKTDLLLL